MDVRVWDKATVEGFYREGFWDSTTLAGRVAEHAANRPEAVAFVDADGERMCWSDYESRSAQVASVLTGLAALHDPVAILLPDRPVVHTAYLAAERAGNVAVGIGPRAGLREIAHLIATTGADVLVSAPEHLGMATDELTSRLEAELGRPLRHVVIDQTRRVLSSVSMAQGYPCRRRQIAGKRSRDEASAPTTCSSSTPPRARPAGPSA